MSLAYLDTSYLVAIALSERRHHELRRRLEDCDQILSSSLLEAELLAALSREQVGDSAEALLSGVEWVVPRRQLSPEFAEILGAGHLQGTDLWHVGCALYLRRRIPPLRFLTLNTQQQQMVSRLGFPGEPPL